MKWDECYAALKSDPTKCACNPKIKYTVRIRDNTLQYWSNHIWDYTCLSFNSLLSGDWELCPDPSIPPEKWVKTDYDGIWSWIAKQVVSGNMDARFRSLQSDGKSVNTNWTVKLVFTNCCGPHHVVWKGVQHWEYLEQ